VLLTQYFSCDKIENNEMGGAFSTYGERRGVYTLLLRNLRERDHLEAPGANGRIILRRIFKNWLWENGLECSGSRYEQVAGTCKSVMNSPSS
jgi:hypothetical protein